MGPIATESTRRVTRVDFETHLARSKVGTHKVTGESQP